MHYHFTENSVFEFYPLHIEKEDHKYIVGRSDTEIYVLIQEAGVKILRFLKKYKTIKAAKEHLPKEYLNFDINAFVMNLISYDFIKTIDGHPLRHHHKIAKPILSWLSRKHVSWLFSWYMYLFYAFIIIFGIYIVAKDAWYIPSVSDFFFTDSFSKLLIIGFVTAWILVGLHEFMHFIAALSRNVSSTIGLSSRFYYLVAVTDFTNVYKLKPFKRMRVYLAGVVFDLLVMFSCIIILYLVDEGILTIFSSLYKFFQFVAFTEFVSVLWQLLFFMKTDFYYVYETLSSCYNINEKAAVMISHWFRRLRIFPRKYLHSYESYFFTQKERVKVLVYIIFYLFGIIMITWLGLVIFLPITIQIFTDVVVKLYYGIIDNVPVNILDALIFIIIYVFQEGLFFYQFVKYHKLQMKRWFQFVLLGIVSLSYMFVAFFILLASSVYLKNTAQILAVILALGFLFGYFQIDLVKHINKHTLHRQINPQLVMIFMTIFVSVFFATLVSFVFKEVGIVSDLHPFLYGIVFAAGMVIAPFVYPLK